MKNGSKLEYQKLERMNKNFELNKHVILTKDWGSFKAGTTGKITAYLPDESYDVIAVYWNYIWHDANEEQPKPWASYKPFDWALEKLNECAEVVETEEEYEEDPRLYYHCDTMFPSGSRLDGKNKGACKNG